MSNFSRPPLRPAAAPTAVRPMAARGNTVEVIMPDQYADRRLEPRSECNDRGVLFLLPDFEQVSCRIIDQSASGARITFDKMSGVATEIWMIDLDANTARHGAPAWSTVSRMGLKFDLVMQLVPGAPRPAKVPEPVHDAWLKLSGLAPSSNTDDALYFD